MTFADDAASGVKLLRPGAFDLLVSDMFAERVDDHVSAERLADVAVRCDMPVIWLQSGDRMMTGGFARRTPRADFLQQPFSPQDLLRRVRIQLALIQTRHELYKENLRIHRELDSHLRSKLAIDCLSNELSVGEYPEHIAGTSFAAARLREQIECAARTNGPLLIVGEVGTGREMAARAIHNRSDRRERPFIKLNCAALARDLLQQELNGVDRAGLRQLCGRMELVQGGTLLLAEVGELPLVYQEKLVRLLRAQHGERRRSGTLRRFDARVLATTNRDLSPLVQKGAFRADLWARLRDCRLYVPALRERQEDIPELLSLFAARAAQKAGKRMPLISSGLRRQAQTYHWPANLIELENCAHRALMFAKNLTLEPDPCLVSPQRLSDVLREHILHVLERTSWHVDGPTGAAHILGIRASALRRRMRELGLEKRAGTSISQGDSGR